MRHDSDTVIDDRAAHEIYLPAFEAAVEKARVGAVMDSYNLIDGEHATQNRHFNVDLLRKDWGFQGVLMSDWIATYDAKAAANGGLDIEMPTGAFMNSQTLKPLIDSGQVSEATIDDKVRHILRTAVSFGWLDREQKQLGESFVDSRNTATALKSAQEGIVLLKNSGDLLPLSKSKVKTILVVGPDAYPAVPVGGGSSEVIPFRSTSALLGLSDLLGPGTSVLFNRGIPTMSEVANGTSWNTAAADGKPGVTLETFANNDLSGSPSVSKISSMKLDGLSTKILMQDIESAMPILMAGPKHSSHRMTGYFAPATPGRYVLVAEGSGEGTRFRVIVDDKVVLDCWELVRALQPHVTLDLTAAPHKVVVEDSQTSAIGGHFALGIIAADRVVNPDAIAMGQKADVILVQAGFAPESESEGSDRTFSLPYGQDELIAAMSKANPNTIVAVTAGGNIDSRRWLSDIPALLMTWYGGQEAGKALAEVLFGDINPSGHLPVTFERNPEDNPTFHHYYPETGRTKVVYQEGIFVGYRGYEKNHVTPLFPFGFGLSYTTFKFSNLAVKAMPDQVGASVSFDVLNWGSREGADVAQVYVTEVSPRVERPARELKGFERFSLKPGESRHVEVTLDQRAFSYFDTGLNSWSVGSDRFMISVGDCSAALPLRAEVHVNQEPQ